MSLAHPLHPYAWECRYTDGRRLRRESPGGPWREHTVPLEGLCEVALLGHHAGPLRIPVGPMRAGVCFRMRGTVTLGAGIRVRHRRWLVGVVDPAGQVDGWRITPAGDAARYRGALDGW